ncbi:myxochelin non-ribosomal peptide synthetase MxcG [Vitiosangium sp. GDMCC 1.1324]|uniref:myxochelin non-ribosomal peptide synthetase MxcG n=1 Tax=Vitiosangium sp. (strain GDMCC 1.1324) TaxID=2138576 RepID=UPI000D33CF4C|nr:myxochelin non-ribosomal peptide synthetase MxcG [Vitiosangium sp. GDMCC 1.1324]PTL85183.1 non-ribosomal peptide synthetase [Vitiosangium sp. GDMCC 1.1324]
MCDSQHARWPLSAAQHGIWLGQQFDLKSPVYNAGECIEIRGPVDPAVFEAALRQAVGEAEALHSRFVSDGDGPGQLLGTQPDWTLHVVDLSGTPDPWAAAQAWMRDDLARPVDLSRGPLFAEALFKAAPDRFFWFQRVHHIAMDGFGFSLLARRVAELYTARAAGRPSTGGFGSLRAVLDEDAAFRAGAQYELDRAFWMERFADRPTPVSLAAPAPMSASFVRQTRHLPTSEVERLQAAARQAGLSWPDLVLATTVVWLHQRTGASEVVLGLPVMSRLGSAALRVPCMAMNIVPLRVPVRPGAALFTLARDVASELRTIRPHLRYRYEQLRRDLRLVGGQRRLFGPVVNIMPFDYALRFAGMPAIAHNISAGPVEDLSIGMYARSDGGGLRVDFDANPVCYRADELDTHQHDFLQLLASLLDAPDRGAIAPRSNVESTSSSVLDGGPLPAPARPVLELISARAREQPDAVAVEHGQQRLSYRELLESARALADRLLAEDVRPDSPVAVMVPRGIDAIVASLGVLFSGAGYLPLDPLGPTSRTSAILDDAAPELIITTDTQHSSSDAGPKAPGHLLVRRYEGLASSHMTQTSRTGEERLAYVIYTSGSTGQPNGVQISRGALAHFVAGATQRYGLRRDDTVLQFAPLHFDASVEEIFLTLCAGARLVLRTDEMLQSVPRLLDACEEHGITVLDLPTAFWHELAYSVSTGAARLPSSLRTVIIGGEAALPERVARWRSAVGPEVQLLNTYGPTEATVVATVATLSGGTEAGPASDEVPIGRPLPGVRAVLIDPLGRIAAPGAESELYLLGGGLARGYLGRPLLDAARFTTLEQLPDRPRAYRTGDRVRLREDGHLVFVGRVDDEFKISGHRVDPAEVETVLLGHPGVREAAVVGQVLPGGTRRLCAHIVAASPAPSAAELRRFLLAELPAPMVPGAFVFAERLPRTSTGKLDRAELRRAQPSEESTQAAAAATGLERVVLRVWEQVLGVNVLSAQDDFFELGGQSLQSIQVANRLGVELGREVSVATVFRYPTAAALAQALERGAEAGAESSGLTAAMLADAELPEEIVPWRKAEEPAQDERSPRATSLEPQAPLRQVLLTGATGFVGAYLLDELLRQTDARVVCLVRARDEAQAMERIRAAMTAWRLPTTRLAERVLAVPADLTQPWLGLGAARFHGLAAECDAVYHNAAVVSVVREYGSLQAVNVRGTRELLRLAAAVRHKPLHYVSTLAVAPQVNLSPEVPEDFVPAHPGLRDGYQQSKWVAERLVQQAAERGLPVAVYRLGRVVGAPDSAIVNPQDLVWRILLAGIPAGALPQLDVGETWTPVDYVARALVRLSLVPRPGAVFNLTPTPEVRLSEVFRWVRDYGYPVDLYPVPEWRARVAERTGNADNSTTLAFFDLRSGSAEPAFGLGPIRCERVTQALAGSGITCPPSDRALLYRYLDYCVEHSLLPRP